MAIQNMPTALQAAIQQGFLEREFGDGLQSGLGYRAVADRVEVAVGIGETLTKTRAGLKAPVTTPMNPASNTNFDNGLTASPFTIEQYTLGIDMYADTIDLNVVTSQVGIANQFLRNAKTNGVQAKHSLDRLCRNALFNAYLGGATRVRVTLGSAGPTIQVDDVRGFEQALANGKFSAVSGSNTASVAVGSNTYTLIGTARDGSNASTQVIVGDAGGSVRGVSGTLTFGSNVTLADGTAGNAVVHANAPTLLRANSRAHTNALVAGDKLTASQIIAAVAALRNNTGMQNELFNLYLDNTSMSQLFADADFKLSYQGQYASSELRWGQVFQLYGCNFIPTNEAPVQINGAVTVRRPILVAPGALVEGDFAGMGSAAADVLGSDPALVNMVDGVAQVTRAPMDRLGQIVAQSWFFIGGFTAPTDATATQAIIPTANQAYLKRAVVLEHA